MNYKIDLHTHTNISDGSCTPKELIFDAIEENIKAIALTDHDNIAGIYEASKFANLNNIDFLNGIEISSLYKNRRIIHILGLGIDINNDYFLTYFYKMKKARHFRINHILNEISKKGIHISIDELKENCLSEYLDRYDIYKYFLKNNICSSPQEIWDKYLDPIPYYEDELININDAINIIKEAGGLSFLAHYNKSIGFKGLTNEQIENEVKYLKNLGLNGIEKYYPSFTETDYKFIDYLINKYDFIYSGGTDYHGSNRPNIKIGSGKNNSLFIPYSVYENIINTKLSNIRKIYTL